MFSFLMLQITFDIYTKDMCPLISQHIIFSCSVWSHLNWEKSEFLSSLLARGKINIRRRWNVINKLEKIGCSLEMNLLPFANSYKIKISTSKKFTLHPNKTSSLESVQDFLIKLDMKPCMHQVEISIPEQNSKSY